MNPTILGLWGQGFLIRAPNYIQDFRLRLQGLGLGSLGSKFASPQSSGLKAQDSSRRATQRAPKP